MNSQKPEEKVIEVLIQLFRKNNYVTESEIADACDDYDIPFHRTDYITDSLLAKGVLISDSPVFFDVVFSDNSESYADEDTVDYTDEQAEIVYSFFEENYPGMDFIIDAVRSFNYQEKVSIMPLLDQAQNGNKLAREYLIRRYLKSALKICYNYRNRTVIPIEDLFPVAVQGIIDALAHYHKNNGSYLVSYLGLGMRQKIDRYIADNQSLIRLPIHLHEKYDYKTILTKYDLDEDNLKNCFGNSETIDKIIQLIKYQTPKSLDEIIELNDEVVIEDEFYILENLEKKRIDKIVFWFSWYNR
ncbi:hypothetical protein [Ruminococcus sp. HUN007]|uniref:hypothetical protein n=1 Tax=Ruminococcus sp. HUN007 TaxID=1514668 RepID=UPI0005D28A08|nr:hypothetical protein [Ruminococcus sp. HUN007]